MKGVFKPEIWLNKIKLQRKLDLRFLKEISSKVSNTEKAKVEVFIDLHSCPWYKNFFNKVCKYKLKQYSASGIGRQSFIICKRCGKIYDITDYEIW